MAGFTETVLQKKLEDLNESQQSIQTLSLWLIHHRKHYHLIVKTWSKEIAIGDEFRKLTLMYLANDVIQNSKKKGPEYTKEFIPALKNAFRLIDYENCNEKTRGKLERILAIWEERFVYDKKQVEEFLRMFKSSENAPVSPSSKSEPPTKKHKKSHNGKKVEELLRSKKNSESKESHIRLSPHPEVTGDPPEVDELIKALTDLENAPTLDVNAREKISKLPAELSEIKLLEKITTKREAAKLTEDLDSSLELLSDYTNRLATELDERRKVTQMLEDYTVAQKQLLQQAEARLEEYRDWLIKVEQVRHEVVHHLSNLPNLKTLPDVTQGLAPLPSAGDLFT